MYSMIYMDGFDVDVYTLKNYHAAPLLALIFLTEENTILLFANIC